MDKQKIIILIIITILTGVLIYGFYEYFNNPNKPNISNESTSLYESGSNNFFINGKLIIYCQPVNYYDFATESYPYWIYSQCAMIEASSRMWVDFYGLSLKKYHVCFIFEDLNESVGDCN